MPTTDADLSDILDLAVSVAREAGDLLLSYRSRDLGVSTKSSATDPVSDADEAAEQLISDRVAEARPDDGLLGEERSRNRDGSSGLCWVVDPLDGTVNYLYGIPQWSVSIGVEDADGTAVGVVHDPSRGETFSAVRGRGAFLGDRPLVPSSPESLATSLVATGFGYDAEVRRHQMAMLQDLIGEVRDIRRLGSAALDLCWVAAGRYDGYVEFGLNPWDRSAGGLVVAEAGARFSMWRATFAGREREAVVAGPATVHDGLAAWLRRQGAVPA